MPLNPFGAGQITQDQVDYIMAKGRYQVTSIKQKNVVASITSDLVDLPAGPVGFALGLEYRDIVYSDVPPEGVQTGSLLGGNSAGPVFGGYDVNEQFAEIRVPILANKPFANYLGFEGGDRYSDYSMDQQTDTWKAGGEWATTEWLRFRALQQCAVRAPSVGELFSTQAEGYPSVTSGNLGPCDKDSTQHAGANAADVLRLCQTQSLQITGTWDSTGTQYHIFSGANPNLSRDAETGLLTNVGLKGSISATDANLATFKASSVDLAVNWHTMPSDYGLPAWTDRVGVATQGTWYDNQQFQSDAASPISDNFVGIIVDATSGESTLPEWKFNTRFNWAWEVNDTIEIFGGIDNLFDKKPPIYASGFQYQTNPSTYDVIGRYFYIGARARF